VALLTGELDDLIFPVGKLGCSSDPDSYADRIPQGRRVKWQGSNSSPGPMGWELRRGASYQSLVKVCTIVKKKTKEATKSGWIEMV